MSTSLSTRFLMAVCGAFIACGGAVATPGGSGASDNTDGGAAGEGGTSSGSGSGTGTGGGTGSGTSGGSGSGGTGTGTGGGGSGGTDPVGADGGVHSVGGSSIACGSYTCDTTSQDCCALQNTFGCVPKGSCPTVTLTCASTLDCKTGEVCCASGGGPGGHGLTTACATTCGGAGTGGGGGMGGGVGMPSMQLCASDAECPKGDTCIDTREGIKACRPAGGGGPGGM
jgi:hypothetical protein